MSPLRVALVVQGRFHAFDLARALADRGHDVTLLTNYPERTVGRFGLRGVQVRSYPVHGVLDRTARAVTRVMPARYPEQRLHELFGRWAARELVGHDWDVVHCWSGVSEELLVALSQTPCDTWLMRGSAHIRVQDRLLRQEERRSGATLDRPTDWMIAREVREYALARRVVVPSSFARESFLAEGFSPERLSVLPLGVDVAAFRAPSAVREARHARILRQDRLRVLYVGALSFQKGLADLVQVAELLRDDPIDLTAVGPRTAEAEPLLAASPTLRLEPKRPQSELPAVYHDADVFLFPTIHDGYGLVLAQAQAAGLPVLTTPHSAGPDMLVEGESGWIVPIRDPAAIADRLRWCVSHRTALASMADRVAERFRPRDWSAVAADFEALARPRSEVRQAPLDRLASDGLAVPAASTTHEH